MASAIRLKRSGSGKPGIVHAEGEKDGVGDSVGDIEMAAQRVGHGVNDPNPAIEEGHSRHGAGHHHGLGGFEIIGIGVEAPQVAPMRRMESKARAWDTGLVTGETKDS